MRKFVGFGVLQWWCATLTLVARPDFGIAAQDGSQIRFTVPPAAVKVAEGTKISFSVSKPTDVEVAILDTKGRVLHHLAAGRLGGEKPPPAPLKPGLVQEMVWDGKDDGAEPVSESSTPLRVRVRAGLKPTFERFLGACPENQGTPVGLACDTKGNLYVVSTWAAPNQHYPGAEIKCFDREGRHLRQVLPFSSKLSSESVTGLRWIELADGSRVPVVWHGANHCVYPQFGVSGLQSLVIRPDGKLTLPNNAMGDEPNGFDNATRRLLILGSDGSVGLDYLGPKIVRKEWRGGCHIMIALSPDGKVIYAAGYRNRGVPVPAVTRTTWEASGEPEIFLGSGSVDGATPEGLQEPRGLAVDARGNLYACDNAAGKVLIFLPDGKRIGQVAVPYPDQIAVHRKTGRIYVLTVKPDPARNKGSNWVQGHNWKDGKSLLRFDGIGATTPSAAMALPSSPAKTSFCLDDSEPVAVIWIAHVQYGKTDIMRVAETENGFTKPENPIRDRVAPGAVPVGYLDMAADPLSGDLYVGKLALKRYSGITGDYLGTLQLESHKRMTSPEWGEMRFSADGSTILFESHRGLFRYDRTGKPAPWPGHIGGDLAPHEVAVELMQGFMHTRGLAPAPDGGFYVLHHREFRACWDGRVSRVERDGNVIAADIVRTDVPVGGIAVGKKGNIYVGAHLKPGGKLLPEWFSIFPGGHLLPTPESPAGWGSQPGQIPPEAAPWYVEQYGMVVKFKPEGGRVLFDSSGAYFAPHVGGEQAGWSPEWRSAKGSLRVEGVEWVWYGLAPMPSRRGTSRTLGGPRCSCHTPRFAVDGFERVYVPDCFRFSVAVLDAAGNLITRFGQYGNQDDVGSGSAIPLGWVYAAATVSNVVYIADMLNHRVAKVVLQAEASAECPLHLSKN